LFTKADARPPDTPSGLPLADASKLVEEADKRIWTPEGRAALGYLRGRGLSDETIKAARLGWTPGVSIPIRDGTYYWRVSGIVIPWVDRDRLALVKIRRLERREPKYVEAFRDRPTLFPDPEAVRPGEPLVVVEGELDALLLGQALGDLAAVLTLGSASSKPEGATYLAMLPAPTWYLAHDADPAGDKAASGWPARAVRVRPPAPDKDWSEASADGVNLGRWWRDRLGGFENPVRATWDELAAMRWGPALGDSAPGVVIDGLDDPC
jgi:DNA primase